MFDLKNGRLHGNGFLQFDLAPGIRLHIWPEPGSKRIIAQKVRTPIHDHAFSFTSMVLCGTLKHIEYRMYLADDGYFTEYNNILKYNVYRAQKTKTEDTILVKDDDREYVLGICDSLAISSGETYKFPSAVFHDSINIGPGIAASIMFKTNVMPNYNPRVLCESTKVPDNDFSRYSVDKEILDHHINLLEQELKNRNIVSDYFRV